MDLPPCKDEITIARLLELLWTYKHFSILDEGDEVIAILRRAKHPSNTWFYLREKDINGNPFIGDGGKILIHVWRRPEWNTEYAKITKDRIESERRCKFRDKKTEQISILASRITLAIPEDTKHALALKLWEEDSRESCILIGVTSIEGILWPKELQAECDKINEIT